MKKGIALLLTAVYLLATAGTAVLSLTCGCAERKAHAEHVCLSECRHDVPDHEVVRACCGCELHSTEIELYISQNSGDDERHIRCTVIDLPPALAAECPCLSCRRPCFFPWASAPLPYRLETPFGTDAACTGPQSVLTDNGIFP